MAGTTFNCSRCGNETNRPTGHVNRARARGDNLYCSRACSGFARRTGKTVEERKAEKSAYDREYRKRDPEELKARKAAYHKATYDPAKAAVERKAKSAQHAEYCRRPEYRQWKKAYDRQYRANKEYGEFADCFLLVMDIREECLSRMTDYEIRLEKGTLNKSTKRRRDYERSICNSPEIGTLGNLERGERGQNGRLSRGRNRLPGTRNPSDHEHAIAGGAAIEAACLGRRDQILGELTALTTSTGAEAR